MYASEVAERMVTGVQAKVSDIDFLRDKQDEVLHSSRRVQERQSRKAKPSPETTKRKSL